MTRLGIAAVIPTAAEDVVAIFVQSDEGNDEQILEQAFALRATIEEKATFYRHPLETGRSVVDHRIIEPVTIELIVLLVDSISVLGGLITGDFTTQVRDTYQQIRTLFDDGTLLSIQTRTTTYRNQILQALPHRETPEMFDGVRLVFKTSEVQLESLSVLFVPSESSDTDTVERGKLNPLDVAAETASNVLSEASAIFLGT